MVNEYIGVCTNWLGRRPRIQQWNALSFEVHLQLTQLFVEVDEQWNGVV